MTECETAMVIPTAIADLGGIEDDVDMPQEVEGSEVGISGGEVEDSLPPTVVDVDKIQQEEDDLIRDDVSESGLTEVMKEDLEDVEPFIANNEDEEKQLVEGSVSLDDSSSSDIKSELVSTKTEEKEETLKEELADPTATTSTVAVAGTTPTKSVALTTEEVEDIILLDDEDNESGVSDSKRPRKDEDEPEVMEVDPNGAISAAEKEHVGKVIRKMVRSDLEDLVLAKIVEAIVAHTEVGQLRSKVLELQLQKDKMANKMGIMMKQVAELSHAVNMITENDQRDPNKRIGKPHVIRFNRSVGLQTSIEPGFRSAPPKIIRVPDSTQNGVKQYGAKQPIYHQQGANGHFNPPQPVKRIYQPNKDNRLPHSQTAAVQPSPRKTYSPATTAPPRIHPIAPKPISVSQSVTVTPISQNVQPGIVDLTDDDPPATGSTPQSSLGTPQASHTIINGVQYQIVNQGPRNTGSVQIVSPGNQTQTKYIVTPSSGQNRPMLLQQFAPGTNQQFMLRNNASPILIQRPVVAPRPAANGSMPRVAATIPVRPTAANVVLGTASNTPRRFVLPPLPATPVPKQRNDMFKPPPKPELTLNEQTDGIVLSWNLPTVQNMAEVTTYQIFACQESLTSSANRPSQWKRVGDVKALPLPMACTLSQFTEENRYYFIVRGIDVYGRVGPFCDPQNILLRRKK